MSCRWRGSPVVTWGTSTSSRWVIAPGLNGLIEGRAQGAGRDVLDEMHEILADRRGVDQEEAAGRTIDVLNIVVRIYHHHANGQAVYRLSQAARMLCTSCWATNSSRAAAGLGRWPAHGRTGARAPGRARAGSGAVALAGDKFVRREGRGEEFRQWAHGLRAAQHQVATIPQGESEQVQRALLQLLSK